MGRRRYRRKSSFDALFDLLFELTGFVWQIGAAVSGVFISFVYSIRLGRYMDCDRRKIPLIVANRH